MCSGYSQSFISSPLPAWHGLAFQSLGCLEKLTASVARLSCSPVTRLCLAENVFFVVFSRVLGINCWLCAQKRHQLGPATRQPVFLGNVFSRDDVTASLLAGLWPAFLLGSGAYIIKRLVAIPARLVWEDGSFATTRLCFSAIGHFD